MTAFALAAGTLVLVAAVLAVRPLIRTRTGAAGEADARLAGELEERLAELARDREAGLLAAADYEAARREIELQILERLEPAPRERQGTGPPHALLAVVIALLLPAASLGLYLHLGEPGLLATGQSAGESAGQSAGQGPAGEPAFTEEQLRHAITRLEGRLADAPEDTRAWALLARAYMALGEPDNVVATFERALRALPEDAELKMAFARYLLRRDAGALAGRAAALVDEVLAARPQDPEVLFLAGAAAWQAGDVEAALARWRRAESRPELGAEQRELVRSLIERAERTRASGIAVNLSLAEPLAASLSGEETVFLFARRAGGEAGPPLAAERLPVSALPARVRLVPGALTGTEVAPGTALAVTARVSRRGEVARRSGDLEGSTSLVLGEQPEVDLAIDARVP